MPTTTSIRRLLAISFFFAFVLGAAGAVFLLRAPGFSLTEEISAAQTKPGDTEDADSDTNDTANSWPEDAGTPEQVMYAQPQLMQAATQQLLPRHPHKTNLYLIGFAGDGDENVFRNEVEYVDRQFSERFDSAGHTLMLINNPATLQQHPLASLTNLQTAVDAVAARMDNEQDVLLLFLTSHGSREHELYVGLDPLPLDQIAPSDLSELLAKSKIRYKVIVISACYSGGFIDALKDSTTMVITAAREDRTSFGCGMKSDITNFGRAFFLEGLNHNDSFTSAFAEAERLIDGWETRDDDEHSYPQLVTTPQIEARLKTWRSGIHLGPPQPFTPATLPPPESDGGTLTAATMSREFQRATTIRRQAPRDCDLRPWRRTARDPHCG